MAALPSTDTDASPASSSEEDSDSASDSGSDDDEVAVYGLRDETPGHWVDPPFSIDCRNLPDLPALPDDWDACRDGGHRYVYKRYNEQDDARLGDADLESVLSSVFRKRYGLVLAPRVCSSPGPFRYAVRWLTSWAQHLIAMLTRNSVLSVLAVAYDLRATGKSIVSDGNMSQHHAADLFEAVVGTMRVNAKLRSARFSWLYELFAPRVFPDLTARIRIFRNRLECPTYETRLREKRKLRTGWGRAKSSRAQSRKGLR
ncbi:hypothetical protein JCM3770_005416 [Rhodotorula araucariae]